MITLADVMNAEGETFYIGGDDFLAMWHAELKHLLRSADRGYEPAVLPGTFMGTLGGREVRIYGHGATRSERTGRMVCGCGKGYASARYGTCKICYVNGLTRRELKAKGLKRL